MELIYVWINKNNCIHQQGFCFSPEYRISMTLDKKENWKLKINTTENINIFKEGCITNITAVVGDNGAGKTTLLNCLRRLDCFPQRSVNKDDNPEYTKEKNEEFKNIILIRVEGKLRIYTNIYKKNITVCYDKESGLTEQDVFYISDDQMRARINILHSRDYCAFTKIYLTNSICNEANVSSSTNGFLDALVMSPLSLTNEKNSFYECICSEKKYKEHCDNTFWKYSNLIKESKSVGEYQQLCDVLFFNHLIQSNAIDDYEGFVQTELEIRFRTAHGLLKTCRELEGEHLQKEYKDIEEILIKLNNIYDRTIGKQSVYYILQSDLIAEYLMQYGFENMDLDKGSTVEKVYEQVQHCIFAMSDDGEEEKYFRKALCEMKALRIILDQLRDIANTLPVDDLGFKVGKCTTKITDKSALKASKYAELLKFISEKIMEIYSPTANKDNQPDSFLLRYITIDNLKMSSGERALQNIMSWIYYLGTVQPCLSSKELVPRENILLLLDEMDLSLHPSWQRDYIYYLIKLINTAYRDKKVQIIMTTHSPLCLSDIPGANVIYLKKTDEGTRIYNERHKETFAANIYELLNDSFYLGNLTMGRFAQNYIKELIRELDIVDKNNAIGDENYNIYRKRIDIIGDELIKQKLHDKLRRRYGEINGREAYLRRLDAEINRLEKEKDRVLRKNDSD